MYIYGKTFQITEVKYILCVADFKYLDCIPRRELKDIR